MKLFTDLLIVLVSFVVSLFIGAYLIKEIVTVDGEIVPAPGEWWMIPSILSVVITLTSLLCIVCYKVIFNEDT